ncbi:MAG: diversity-generating retroelement protein Avd [bacterium]
MTRATDEISVIVKTYDFTLWLLPHIAKFSRDHRFTLGNRLEEGALDVMELLVAASYASDKRPLLQQANTRLNRVRYLVRLSKDLRLINVKQYEFAARAIDGIGVEIGGWLKQQSTRRGNHEAPPASV